MYNSINNEVGKDFSLVLAGNKFDIVNQEEVRDRYGKSLGGPFYSFIWESNKDRIDNYFEELVKKY